MCKWTNLFSLVMVGLVFAASALAALCSLSGRSLTCRSKAERASSPQCAASGHLQTKFLNHERHGL